MSAMAIDSGGSAPLADFQATVLPSAETETVPSCFLYWAAASAMAGGRGERAMHGFCRPDAVEEC